MKLEAVDINSKDDEGIDPAKPYMFRGRDTSTALRAQAIGYADKFPGTKERAQHGRGQRSLTDEANTVAIAVNKQLFQDQLIDLTPEQLDGQPDSLKSILAPSVVVIEKDC